MVQTHTYMKLSTRRSKEAAITVECLRQRQNGFGVAISTAVMKLQDKQRMFKKSKSRQGWFVMFASRYVEHASTQRRNNKQNEQNGYGLRMHTYHLCIHS